MNTAALMLLAMPSLALFTACDLGSGAGASQPQDYVGDWITAEPLGTTTQSLHVDADGSYTLSEFDGSDWLPSDQGTWSSPSTGVLELDGATSTLTATLVTGCEILQVPYANPLLRQDAATSCAMPAAPLDDSESCLVGTFQTQASTSSQSGLVASDSDASATLILDASRTFTYTTASYQGSAGVGQETQGEAIGTWTYAAGTLMLQQIPASTGPTALAVTTSSAGNVCIGGTCFAFTFPSGCDAGSL